MTLRNEDVDSGVTIHWHGVDVPNAEDGVPGVTQDAVMPGGRYMYRFRPEQRERSGTTRTSPRRRRSGAASSAPLVIEPPRRSREPDSTWSCSHTTTTARPTLNGSDRLTTRQVVPGTPVRLRLVNTDSTPHRFTLAGTPFRVLAIDGTDLNEPQPLENTSARPRRRRPLRRRLHDAGPAGRARHPGHRRLRSR